MPDALPRSLALTWSMIKALAGPCAMLPVSCIRSVTTSTMMNELANPSISVDAHIPMSPTTTNGNLFEPESLRELTLSDTRPARGWTTATTPRPASEIRASNEFLSSANPKIAIDSFRITSRILNCNRTLPRAIQTPAIPKA